MKILRNSQGTSIIPNATIVERTIPYIPIYLTAAKLRLKLTSAEISGLNLSSCQTPPASLNTFNNLVVSYR